MNTALIITGSVIIAFVLLILRAKSKMKNIPLVSDHQRILKLTDKNFRHQTKDKVILVDFWAAWCGPCRLMAPVLNEIAGELDNRQYIGKVDVEQYQSLARNLRSAEYPLWFYLETVLK